MRPVPFQTGENRRVDGLDKPEIAHFRHFPTSYQPEPA